MDRPRALPRSTRAASPCARSCWTARRPAGLLDVVRQLTLLQIDPTAAIAPNADLVAWSRLGSSYSPAELDTALADRTLLELRAMIRPSEDLALYRAEMAGWEPAERGQLPGWRASQRDWVRANDACRRDILDRLGSSGPLPSRELPGHLRGAVAVDRVDQQPQRHAAAGVHGAARRGRDRRAAGRRPAVGPGGPGLPRRPGGPGATRRGASATSGGCGRSASPGPGDRSARSSRLDVGEVGEPAVVEGVKGTWRVDPVPAGPAVRGAGGAAVAVRPADPRPQAHGRALRVRLPAGDVQAGRQAPLGVLRAADPVRRPAGRASSTPPPTARPGCCGSTRSTRTCRSTGHDRRGGRRDQGPGPLARTGPHVTT